MLTDRALAGVNFLSVMVCYLVFFEMFLLFSFLTRFCYDFAVLECRLCGSWDEAWDLGGLMYEVM